MNKKLSDQRIRERWLRQTNKKKEQRANGLRKMMENTGPKVRIKINLLAPTQRKGGEKKLKLMFSPIDAKETSVIYVDNYDGYPHTFKNFILMLKAELEYLEKLNELQQKMRNKYEPLLLDDSDVPFDSDKFSKMDISKESNEISKKIYRSNLALLFYT